MLRGHKMAVLCLAVTGRVVVSGSADRTISVWRREEGANHARLAVLTGHTGPVKCVAMDEEDATAADGHRRWVVYSGSLDGSVKKTLKIYNQPHIIKYQLPDEDLDALISLSCDEDLQNMMEEYSSLEKWQDKPYRQENRAGPNAAPQFAIADTRFNSYRAHGARMSSDELDALESSVPTLIPATDNSSRTFLLNGCSIGYQVENLDRGSQIDKLNSGHVVADYGTTSCMYGNDKAFRHPDHLFLMWKWKLKNSNMLLFHHRRMVMLVARARVSYEDRDDEPAVDGSISDAAIAETGSQHVWLADHKNADLEELRELGAGTFGTVYHGKWRGTDVAIKRIKKSCFAGRSSEQEKLTKDFWREAQILSKLHHPNVVAFYGVVPDGTGGTLATVAEFMVNGSLRNVLLRKDRMLDRRKKLIIAMDAAFGMEYLHSKSIVHFDLKCDNLLVNLRDPQRPICKVGDFGFSRVSEKVDVFSFGIALWEILTGEEPYANMHCGTIIGGIVNNTLRPPIPKNCEPEWQQLMEQCWSADPDIRPSFTEVTDRLRAMSPGEGAGALDKDAVLRRIRQRRRRAANRLRESLLSSLLLRPARQLQAADKDGGERLTSWLDDAFSSP
ncbi:hypothetical protein GUJ93_ZPchr0820g22890 [Zizania palustris]|uniref:Protein kinase domain-containing protein n=1 Tax=Zizania palustris TaxID=103762 RepID=A0A8J5RNT5_ZIZPA|nr:hypothetical protein GUJ93_ZPchr0820g22890 [Zizania palustris]